MTVSVTDSEGAVDTEIITITVSDVNSAPILANIGTTKYVNEGASLAFTANATDSDDPTDTLAFSLSTFAPPAPSGHVTVNYDRWRLRMDTAGWRCRNLYGLRGRQ